MEGWQNGVAGLAFLCLAVSLTYPSGTVAAIRWSLGALALVAVLWLSGCVGHPAVCATTWEVRGGVEQSYITGAARPTGEMSVGGEFGSDRCVKEEVE
jgi:hypothetical protein